MRELPFPARPTQPGHSLIHATTHSRAVPRQQCTTPSEVRALARNWRDLPLDRIRELRRHKDLTAHLERLIGHLKPGPTRDRLLRWIEVRCLLP